MEPAVVNDSTDNHRILISSGSRCRVVVQSSIEAQREIRFIKNLRNFPIQIQEFDGKTGTKPNDSISPIAEIEKRANSQSD
jgi:hypothetical protein